MINAKQRAVHGRVRSRGKVWFAIGMIFGLWGVTVVLAQDVKPQDNEPAAQDLDRPELVLEMHFAEDGPPRVLKNDIARLRSEGRISEFPVKAMVAQEQKKIVWFDGHGEVKREREFPEAARLEMTEDGRRGIIVTGAARGEGGTDIEILNENGGAGWKRPVSNYRVSPTGNCALVHIETEYYDPSLLYDRAGNRHELPGLLFRTEPVFSKDGEFVLGMLIETVSKKDRLVLVTTKGEVKWAIDEIFPEGMPPNKLGISDDAGMAVVSRAFGRRGHIEGLDNKGERLWKKDVGYGVAFDYSDNNEMLGAIVLSEDQEGARTSTLCIFDSENGNLIASHSLGFRYGIHKIHLTLMDNGDHYMSMRYTQGRGLDSTWKIENSMFDIKGSLKWRHTLDVNRSQLHISVETKARIATIHTGTSVYIFDLN